MAGTPVCCWSDGTDRVAVDSVIIALRDNNPYPDQLEGQSIVAETPDNWHQILEGNIALIFRLNI